MMLYLITQVFPFCFLLGPLLPAPTGPRLLAYNFFERVLIRSTGSVNCASDSEAVSFLCLSRRRNHLAGTLRALSDSYTVKPPKSLIGASRSRSWSPRTCDGMSGTGSRDLSEPGSSRAAGDQRREGSCGGDPRNQRLNGSAPFISRITKSRGSRGLNLES